MNKKTLIGTVSAVLAAMLSIYILLLMLNIAHPMNLTIVKEEFIRFMAQLTVFLYLLAAWAFWRI
jgi:hypothetical protein